MRGLSMINHSQETQRLKPLHWKDLDTLPRRKALIKGLLDKGGMSVIYGESNCGKTFFALDIVVTIALGNNWQGFRTRQGAVAYLALEGGLGISERLSAIKKHKGISDSLPPLYLIPTGVDFGSEENDTEELISELVQIASLEMVVIDTLSRAMAGGNENASEDMTAFIRNCDLIRQKTGAHVCLIHHAGKDQSRGARGHSSLRAAVDTEIEIVKTSENQIISAEVKKQRDGKIPEPFYFQLEPVFLEKDEDGDDLFSCVLVETDQRPTKRKKAQKKDALRVYKDIFTNCLLDKGQKRLLNSAMPQVSCVTRAEYIEALHNRDVSAAKETKDKEKTYRRNLEKLILEGYLVSMVKSGQTYLWSDDLQPTSSTGDRTDTTL